MGLERARKAITVQGRVIDMNDAKRCTLGQEGTFRRGVVALDPAVFSHVRHTFIVHALL